MKRTGFVLLCLILGFAEVPSARAATLRAMKLADLTHGADVIFVGTAVSSVSAWNAEHNRIYTRTTFQVEEYLKGHTGGTIVVETLGGIVRGVGMRAPGMPVFRVKGKHVLFVKTGRVTGTHRVLGWAQGDFSVRKDPGTGREIVTRDFGEVSLVGGPAPNTTQDLDEFKAAINRLNGR